MIKLSKIIILIFAVVLLCSTCASAGFFDFFTGFLIKEDFCGDGYCSAKEEAGYASWGECPDDCAGRVVPSETDMYLDIPDANNPKILFDAVSKHIFVAWEENDAIYGQIVSLEGRTIVKKFMISYEGEKSFDVQVDIDSNTAYIIWAVDESSNKIRMKTYDFDGQQLDVKTIAQSINELSSPDIAALDYKSVVTWTETSSEKQSTGPIAYTWDIKVKLMEFGQEDADGVVATLTDDTKRDNGLETPRVAVSEKERFIITWTDLSGEGDGSGSSIHAQEYYLKATGITPKKKGDTFRVNTIKAGDQKNADVSYTKDGYFVVTWETNPSTAGFSSIVAKRFRPNHKTKNEELQVSSSRKGHQYNPNIVGNKHHYIINWQGGGNEDGYGYAIFSQFFDEGGNRIGTNDMINGYGGGEQIMPAIAYYDSNQALHAWYGKQKDGDEGITLKIF
ncbi:MAG: hypothetical protein ABIF40_03245 [archaeon]